MSAIKLQNLLALVLLFPLFSLAGCGSSGSAPPCSGATCPAPGSDYLFETNTGQISTFQVNSSDGTVLATLPTVPGPATAGGMVLSSTNFLYVSDYQANAVNAFMVSPTSGALTAVAGSPFTVGTVQGAEGMAVDPAGKFLFVTQPNTDQVAAFTINAGGQLTKVAGSPFPAGVFPVQAVVDPSGSFLYVSNSEGPLGGISAYSINPSTGVLTQISGSPFETLPNGGPTGMAVHPSGKFLFVAMAGTGVVGNQIVVESINTSTGVLSQVGGSPFSTGNRPHSVALDPAGEFLFSANVQDNTVTGFRVDPNAGTLTGVSGNPFPAGPGPFKLVVNPSGTLLFAAAQASTSISVFTIDSSTGALTAVAPISGGGGATGLAAVQHP